LTLGLLCFNAFVSTGSVAVVVSGILALYNLISRWRGGFMIDVLLSYPAIDFFEDFSLTGKHQPRAMFTGCPLLTKKYSEKQKEGDENVFLNYEYSAYAVSKPLHKCSILVLHRKTLRFYPEDTFWDEHEDLIYSKYIVPKDKMDVQKFDCPNPEEKFIMRPQYEEFIRELSQQLYENPHGFYLSVDEVMEVSSGK
jgi:hypothetical protein